MKLSIVQIGNSKGFRIPKIILEQCHMTKEVDLIVNHNCIILKPVADRPRKNWKQAFKKMHELRADVLDTNPLLNLDLAGWTWK
jgi:antitoxin MazE